MTGQAAVPPPRRQASREQAEPGPVAPPRTAIAPPAAAPSVLRAVSVVPVAAAVAGPPPPAAATAPPSPAPPPLRVPAAVRPSAPPRPAARRPRRVVLPIVVGELVLVLVLLTLDRSWPAIAGVACAGGVLGAFAAVRVRGRLLCQWVVVAGRFLFRERVADLPGEHVGAALLRLLRPGARCAHTMIGDARAFVVSDAAGVATVLRPESGPPVPAPRDLLPDADKALAYAVQVVHHASVDRSQPPRVWLTLQALRTAEVWTDDDVRAALANVVRRVRRRAGLPLRMLTEEETLRSYAALAHVNLGRGRVREEWWSWHSGPIRQATFAVDGWGDLDPSAAARLVRWLLAAAPDTAVTLSCSAHHDPVSPVGVPVVAAVLRVATSKPEALEAAVVDMARLADEVGVVLRRLDGVHVRGVAATLPGGVTSLA
ncbi:hypothetical protein [Actinophytocola sp. NPDC049390]|uniref:hypothetical protein n=1 Tax=Actinophytocola sp. NPDC049390 TaxID=3363894 RepID=UPI0037BB9D66